MGLIIENGADGQTLQINNEGRALTKAVASTAEHHANHAYGQAFVVNFAATPTGAGDCFLYIKNSDSEDMILEGFGLYLAAAEYIDIIVKDIGTPAGGASITPVNANTGSGNIASGTFQHGNDITGLSGGSTLYRIYHASSTETKYHNFEMDIILPKNGVVAMYVQTGTTALAGYVDLIYHD